MSVADTSKCNINVLSGSPQVATLLPTPLNGRGPSYTCGVLATEMSTKNLKVTLLTPKRKHFSVAPASVIEALPLWTRYMPYRLIESWGRKRLERAFLDFVIRRIERPSAAYIFSDSDVKTIVKLRESGIPVFREQINCHRGTAKPILDNAYKKLGMAPRHTITEKSVRYERELLDATDYIFCPNAMVEASLIENGVPAHKLIKASYGWDPKRFTGTEKLLAPIDGLTVTFVGTISVRKGAHLLLDYWAKSRIEGRLILAGQMEPAIKERCANYLGREDVVVLDYVENVGALYRSTDVFAFPSLEEGGPQVTYEACGCGLPVITTPMGAGRIIRHNREGFILDPYNGIDWISALRQLAENPNLRCDMGNASLESANQFTWNKVADVRAQEFLKRIYRPSA